MISGSNHGSDKFLDKIKAAVADATRATVSVTVSCKVGVAIDAVRQSYKAARCMLDQPCR